MKITVNRKIGTSSTIQIEIEEKDDKEALEKALFYTQNDYCSLCKKSFISWSSNKANTTNGVFIYIKRKCLGCGAESVAGTYKTGGLFWKQWEMPNYKRQGKVEQIGSDEITVDDVSRIMDKNEE